MKTWMAGRLAVDGSLYNMHRRALHGTAKTALTSLARILTRRTEPRVKLS